MRSAAMRCFGLLLSAAIMFVFVFGLVQLSSRNDRRNYLDCRRTGYDTRLQINRDGVGELYLYNRGVSLRAVRDFHNDERGLRLQLRLENTTANQLPSSVEVDLSDDGLNNSVIYANPKPSIGTVMFHLNRLKVDDRFAPAVIQLKSGSQLGFYTLGPNTNWWTNPNSVLDSDNREIASIRTKPFSGNSKNLAICGHLQNIELTMLLAAMVQEFQKYGTDCRSLLIELSAGTGSCWDCLAWRGAVCRRRAIKASCEKQVKELRQKCKGITY